MEVTVEWWDPTGSKPGEKEGRGEEPGGIAVEVPGVTRDRKRAEQE